MTILSPRQKKFPHLALLLPAVAPLALFAVLFSQDLNQLHDPGQVLVAGLAVAAAALVALVIEAFILPDALRRLWTEPRERTPGRIFSTGFATLAMLVYLVPVFLVMRAVLAFM